MPFATTLLLCLFAAVGAPAPGDAPPPRARWRTLRGWLWIGGAYLAVTLLDEVGTSFPPLRALVEATEARRDALLATAVVLAAGGWLGFMAATFALLLRAPPPGRRAGSEAWTVAEMKAAWRSGAWWREATWRRRFVATASALVMSAGLFGLPFVLGSPGVKVLAGLALAYLAARTLEAVVRA